MRQLVDERLGEKRIVRMPHRAPIADRHAAVGGHVRDELVLDRVGQVVQALDGGLVRCIDRPGQRGQRALHPARLQRVAGAAGVEHRDAPVGVEPRAQQRGGCGAVEVVGEVLLARPVELHRAARGLLRHTHRLRDEVDFEPATETATEVSDVHGHRVRVDAGHARRRVARQARYLGRRPHLDTPVAHARRAVHRLHRRVGEIRCTVQGFDPLGRSRQRELAVAAAVEAEAALPLGGIARRGFERSLDALGVQRPRWAVRAIRPATRAPPRARARWCARPPRGQRSRHRAAAASRCARPRGAAAPH